MGYNRYIDVNDDGSKKFLPFIKLSEKSSDIFVNFNHINGRLDKLSFKYYGDPTYGWLILQANPKLHSLSYGIENSGQIRIPFPLNETIQEYNEKYNRYKLLYLK